MKEKARNREEKEKSLQQVAQS